MNYEELFRVINESGLKKKAIATSLGLTPDGLYRRLSGKTRWRTEEIVALGDLLGLTKRQRNDIFLP